MSENAIVIFIFVGAFLLTGIWSELSAIKSVLQNMYLMQKNEISDKKWGRK